MYWRNSCGRSCNTAVGLWLANGCIHIKETVHEDVVGFMSHGTETSGGLFCELLGVHKKARNFSTTNSLLLNRTAVAMILLLAKHINVRLMT